MVAAPSVVYIEATTAAGTTTIPAVSTHTEPLIGDLCVITQTGNQTNANTPTLPTYTSGGADAGFARDSGIQNVGANNGKSNVYSKVLTSSDFSSSQLKQFTLDSAPYNGHRVAILIFRHANGFDATRVFEHVEETASFAVNTAQSLTDCGRAAVVVQAAGWSTGGVTNPSAKWDGGTARLPYCDKSLLTVKVGGHLDRTDVGTGTYTSGSPTVLDIGALATDVGAQFNSAGLQMPQFANVLSASAGVSLTFDQNATASASLQNVLLAKHYGFNMATQTSGVDYNEYADSDTIASWSWSAGTNNTTHAFTVVTYAVADIGAASTATETDTAIAIGHYKSVAIGTATETDTAFPITRFTGSHAVATATETDTAPTISPSHVHAAATATETDTSPAISPSHVVSVGLAVEGDVAFSLQPQTTRSITFLLSDPGDHGSATKKLLVYANKTDSLESGTIAFDLYDGATLIDSYAETPLTTVDTAYQLNITGTITDFTILEVVITIGSAGGFTAQINSVELVFDNEVGTATETDIAPEIRPSHVVHITTTPETDTAGEAIRIHGGRIGVALEVDTANTVGPPPSPFGNPGTIITDSRARILTFNRVRIRE